MIRAIIWKEWHEHRAKYVAYWLGLNAPLLLVALAVQFVVNGLTDFGLLKPLTTPY